MLLFFIPRRIHMIVLGYLLVDLLRLLGIYLLDELSGNSGVDAARLDVLLSTTEPAAMIAPSPTTA